MLARTHWVRIQRSIYARLKAYARQFLGGLTPELKKYFAEYQRDFRRFQGPSSKAELLRELMRSQVIFCGDYHTLSQAQRTVIRLLRDLLPRLKRREIKPILAIEMARPRDNRWLDAYLSRQISESEFLRRIGFKTRWGFPWENYRQLFQFARENGIRMAGINLAPSRRRAGLKERDKFAADIISKLCLEDGRNMVFVLMGDLHLAENHLPRETKLALEKLSLRRRQLVIHQNSETLYWKLVERGLEQVVDVVKLKKSIYCVMNTPPWVKLQSHLRWAEQVSSAGGVSLPAETAKAFPDEEPLDDSVDYSDEVRELLTTVRRFLGLAVTPDDHFSVASPGDTLFLDRLRQQKKITQKQATLILAYLWEFESQFIPQGPTVFLKSADLNHLSTQATHYLHWTYSGFPRLFESPARDFYPYLWIEALGFLGSKVVNHKRKCNGPRDMAAMAHGRHASARARENARVALFALKMLAAETRVRPKHPELPDRCDLSRAVFHYKAAKLLGRLLGDALYRALIDNRVSRTEIRRLFATPLDDSARARSLYFAWIRRLDAHGYRDVHKRERL